MLISCTKLILTMLQAIIGYNRFKLEEHVTKKFMVDIRKDQCSKKAFLP